MALRVDVHCHTFNADDLPIRGFLERVVFHNVDLGRDVAALADVLIQGAAPGYTEEKRTLDSLLARADGLGPEAVVPGPPDLAAETDEAFDRLIASEPALMRRLGVQMVGGSADAAVVGPEGVGDWIDGAKRAISFVKLFGMRRLDITSLLVGNFGRDEVDLFTPMLVDLGMGLYDLELTTMQQQVELHEKISRLSMKGKLPGTTRSRVHPFVGFDPRREMLARHNHDVETPLELVRRAVEIYGFIGVKVYPPMGWRPIDNEPTLDMTADEATEIDSILRDLYRYCEVEHVPITAHCNKSNGAHSSYYEFSDPRLWAKVLADFPGLHLNLGHFGGTRDAASSTGWPRAIAALAGRPGGQLYADVGCHRVDKEEEAAAYISALELMFKDPATSDMQEHLMYGSDWFMLAALPDNDKFLDAYSELYTEAFGDAAAEHFLGGAARSFLGFDREHNKNRQRLVTRYQEHAPDRLPNWLTDTLRQ